MKKVLITLCVPFLASPIICSCSTGDNFKQELKTKLEQLTSVVQVNEITMKNDKFKCGYEVFFDIPLDWNNPNGEKIKQRVVIDAKAFNLPTVVELQGYTIGDKYINDNFTRELPTLIDSNFMVIEHRFFAKSSYSKANYEDAAGWEQLTVKNAAHDHNFIIGELRKVFTDKFVATGHSKGGYITNCLACLYPETCDVYIPFVAPCLSQYDERPFDFIYNEAGDSTFGKEGGKIIRDNLLKFQVFCFEHKDELMEVLLDEEHSPKDKKYRSGVSKENLFDFNMVDFAYGFWQYGYCEAKEINDFVTLPESNKEEIDNKIKEALRIIIKGGGEMTNVSYNSSTFPYYITAHKEMGNYAYDFSYLKQMAQSMGKTITVSVDVGEEIYISDRIYLSEDQVTNIHYDKTMYDALHSWIADDTIETKVIMINGQEDPWFHGSLPIPEKIGKNIKVYTEPFSNHRVQITSFNKTVQAEIMNYIRTWLDIKE